MVTRAMAQAPKDIGSMSVTLACAVAVTVALGATGAGAETRDDRIQTLYTYCKDETAESTLGYCLSYLNGSWEYLNVLSAFPGAVRAAGICAPPASMMQLQRVFLNWAERNPQRWSENRAFGVQAAFSEAWPCK
jgi:Rap1a immunity proteins